MPKCAKCYEMLPPNFCAPLSAEDVQCLFCENELTEITINKGNTVEKYTKKDCIEDYKKLMNFMKDKTEKLKEAKAAADFSKGSGLILPGSPEFDSVLKKGG